MGLGVIRGPYGNGGRKTKPIYRWHALGYGDMKRAIALMYSMLSERRRQQADLILNNPPDPRGRRYSRDALAEFEAIEVPGWQPPR